VHLSTASIEIYTFKQRVEAGRSALPASDSKEAAMTITRHKIRYASEPYARGAPPYPSPRARSTHAVVHNKTVYIRGQVSDDPTADVKKQTEQVLAAIEKLLLEVGSSKSKLLWASIWLADIRDIDAHNEVWDAWIDPENPPARAAVEARLGAEFQKVEIAAVAAID
jgi:enamine deaminase RidA (YjgF/YER057c/UK114 family)